MGHTGSIEGIAFSPDGSLLASAGGFAWPEADDTVRLWEVSTGVERRRFEGHAGAVLSVAFSPDGTVRLWAVAFTADGEAVASGGAGGNIMLWETATGRELRTLSGHADRVRALAMGPDGKVLASASDDDTLRFWDVAAGRQIASVHHPGRDVLSVAISPDGQTLACGVEKDLLIYDLEPPQECLEWWLREAAARSQDIREEPLGETRP